MLARLGLSPICPLGCCLAIKCSGSTRGSVRRGRVAPADRATSGRSGRRTSGPTCRWSTPRAGCGTLPGGRPSRSHRAMVADRRGIPSLDVCTGARFLQPSLSSVPQSPAGLRRGGSSIALGRWIGQPVHRGAGRRIPPRHRQRLRLMRRYARDGRPAAVARRSSAEGLPGGCPRRARRVLSGCSPAAARSVAATAWSCVQGGLGPALVEPGAEGRVRGGGQGAPLEKTRRVEKPHHAGNQAIVPASSRGSAVDGVGTVSVLESGRPTSRAWSCGWGAAARSDGRPTSGRGGKGRGVAGTRRSMQGEVRPQLHRRQKVRQSRRCAGVNGTSGGVVLRRLVMEPA